VAEYRWPQPSTNSVVGQEFKWPTKGTPTPPAWNPLDENPLVWFRADTLTQSAGVVTSWTDKSGNGYNATPTNGPTVVSGVLNGQPVVRFVSASTQYLTFGGSTTFRTKNDPLTFVIVAKLASALGSGVFQVLFCAGSDMAGGIAGGWHGYANFANNAGYPPLFFAGGQASPNTVVGVSGFDYSSDFFGLTTTYDGTGNFSDSTKWQVFKDNVAQTVANAAGTANTSTIQSHIAAWLPPGSELCPDADIAEIILFPSVFDSTALGNLHGYLFGRYGKG